MLEALEKNAAETQKLESQVEGTVRRASVIVDPERCAQAIQELEAGNPESMEAARVVNETWSKRLDRRSSLLEDIAQTRKILEQLQEASPEEASSSIDIAQELLGKME